MPIESWILIVIWLALNLYVVLGGADFGAGIWEVNTAFQASKKERSLLYTAIGPVWEANHVWLIFVLVCTHAAFPLAYSALAQALWLPLFLTLVGIVFRGAAYAFRSHAKTHEQRPTLWEVTFAVASVAAPFFLGAAGGAVASGRLEVTSSGEFTGDFLTAWISPLSIYTGFFSVGICAYLASLFLYREATVIRDAELTSIWRQRGLATGLWMGVLSLAGFAFPASEPASFLTAFRDRAWPLFTLGLASGFSSLIALWLNRPTIAVVGAVTTVSSVLWGWGVSQYPFIVPPNMTLEQAKGPDSVLYAMLISIVVGMAIMAPCLAWLFMIFKSDRSSRVLDVSTVSSEIKP